MVNDEKEAAEIVEKLKDAAQNNPVAPFRQPPEEQCHHFPDGLDLCLTEEIRYTKPSASLRKKKTEEISTRKRWHLYIARPNSKLSDEEVAIWQKAFFEERPDISFLSPAVVRGVKGYTLHSFWNIF
jgi:hypothetical protein